MAASAAAGAVTPCAEATLGSSAHWARSREQSDHGLSPPFMVKLGQGASSGLSAHLKGRYLYSAPRVSGRGPRAFSCGGFPLRFPAVLPPPPAGAPPPPALSARATKPP